MLQYMVLTGVQRSTPGLQLCGYDMPMWLASAPCTTEVGEEEVALGGRYIPTNQLSHYFRKGVVNSFTVGALCFDIGKLGTPAEHREQFVPPRSLDVEVFGQEHIVVSVRGAEILTDVHPDYGPIPLSFIDQVVRSSGKRPVFVGQLGDDVYSAAIRARFPSAVFRPSQGELVDFETLRRAAEIVVSVSTFAWVAAWLSEADRIHLPVSGLYNPRQRPDIDLLPINDQRYRFYEFDVHQWHATDEDFERLWADRNHRELSVLTLKRRKLAARLRMLPGRLSVSASVAWQCRRRAASRR